MKPQRPVLGYLVTNKPEATSPATAVGGEPVLRLEDSGLLCLYSEIERDAPALTSQGLKDSAVQFYSVVREVFGHADVIPFRFPTVMSGQGDLEHHLHENGGRYREALISLAGQVQFDLIGPRPNLQGKPASGTEYLRAKQAAAAVHEALVAEIDARARTQELDVQLRPDLAAGRIHALVNRARARQFKAALADMDGQSLRITGPWPPSAFAEEMLRS